MKPYKNIFILFCCLIFSGTVSAQVIDSLKKALVTANDTQRVNVMLMLGDEYNKGQKFEEAEKSFKEAETEAAKTKNNLFVFRAAIRISNFYYRRGEFPKSIAKAEDALETGTKNKNEIQIAEANNLMGMNSGRLGDFKKALEFYQQALPVFEKKKNYKNLFVTLTSIAGIYFDQQDFDPAIDYFKKALKLGKEQNNQKQIGSSLNNIAAALHSQNKNEEAKQYYLEAVAINKACGNMNNLGYNYMNLASIETEEGHKEKAIEYNDRAKEILEKEGDKYSLVQILWQSADIESSSGHNTKAVQILERATKISEETGSPLLLERTLRQMASAYYLNGDYKKSASSYERYIITKDSIINDEVRNAVTKKQMQFEFDKQLMTDSIEQALRETSLKDKIAASEKESSLQKKILFISFGALALLAGLMVVVYRSYQQNKKSSKIISAQKEKVEEQKLFLELKNKEIVDSINYAKSIQEAILPEKKSLDVLLKDYFILFQPRDIVSGDFYWAAERNGFVFVAVADCTGHGVPGAFMSMLGVSLLNEIVIEKGIESTGEILNQLRNRIILALKQDDLQSKHKDGMDISIIRIHKSKKELVFSSAMSKALLFTNGEMKVIKGDSQPIGLSFGQTQAFTEQKFIFNEGDMVYLMTDGMADQFGGKSGKKFKFKPLLNTISNYCRLDVKIQREKIHTVIEEWKSGHEQVDDICMVGMRL